MHINRVFLMIIDSFGIGALPDAADYGDAGSDTFASVRRSKNLNIPNMQGMGLYNIDGIAQPGAVSSPTGCFARLAQTSKGKDTIIGHWEIAGVISENPLPTYPDGFPPDVVAALEDAWGRKSLCNKPYSGTEVIAEYGKQHMKTGALILYTSADSVLQIAAHEEVVPLDELYAACEKARAIMQGKNAVGRIIARPFTGKPGSFTRTANRHDYSLPPPVDTMLDNLAGSGYETIGIGKIEDIFAGRGISRSYPTKGNADAIDKTISIIDREYSGIAFVNLVDFDMLYGHRRNVDGYAAALSEFDKRLGEEILPRLRGGDILILTADHGCDPGAPGTDHTREYVPLLVYGPALKKGINLGTRRSFADIAATVQEIFNLKQITGGESFLGEIML